MPSFGGMGQRSRVEEQSKVFREEFSFLKRQPTKNFSPLVSLIFPQQLMEHGAINKNSHPVFYKQAPE
jgi:hypothetical protein